MSGISRMRFMPYTVYEARANMLPFNEAYRSCGHPPGCFFCHHRFKEGDEIGMAITNEGNKFLCGVCATQLENELGGREIDDD